MPSTYILRCADGAYYVGSTWHLAERIEQHQAGGRAAFTRRRLPVELIWSVEFERIEDAYALEKQVQGWSRAKREALMRGELSALPALSRRRVGRPRADTGVEP